jgi:hypothetical protein
MDYKSDVGRVATGTRDAPTTTTSLSVQLTFPSLFNCCLPYSGPASTVNAFISL